MNRFFKSLLSLYSLTAILQFSFMGYFYYLMNEPSWVHFENIPFPTKKKVYHAGERVAFDLQRCSDKKIRSGYTITREFFSYDTKKSIFLDSTDIPIEPGCTTVESHSTVLPGIEALPPGEWVLRGDAIIPGTINRVLKPWTTDKFTVAE